MTRSDCPRCGVSRPALSEPCEICGAAPEWDEVACERCSVRYAGRDACPRCGRLRTAQPCARHPGRSGVSRCLICGVVLCRRCERGGGPYAVCAADERIPMVEGWAEVYRTGDEVEGRLLSDRLRAEGVASQVLAQKDLAYMVGFGELSRVRVLVPAIEYGRALRLLERDPGRGDV